jgi:adenylyltransferase/sulfurtransferase
VGSRYHRQEALPGWGARGQARLAAARAVVVGVGALGGAAAALLVRAGVGRVRLVDPDRVSLDNLHRQLLYTQAQAKAGRPKAAAAAEELGRAGAGAALEPVVAALGPDNAAGLLAGAQVVVDGLDNARGRYALNRACLELGLPWVHAGVRGSGGQVVVLRPGGPCLRCWLEPPEAEPGPPPVMGPAAVCLASLQAAEALKLLLGAERDLLAGMLVVELWPPRFRQVAAPPRAGCPDCGGPG